MQFRSDSIVVFFLLLIFSSCLNQPDAVTKTDYPIAPVPFTQVQLTDNFWLPRIVTNSNTTIPIAFQQSEETGRIKNFEVAGGLTEGSFCSTYPFDDSDVFKIMEGAAYSLMVRPDPQLERYLDSLIHKIGLAQEADGYLYTNRSILGDSAHEWAGQERWQHVHEHSHELYNVGHMYEAAVAHFQATGKRSFLDIAIKNADLVCTDFGWGKIERYPGHQEIEIGLVKLYRATGDSRYLEQAKFFLDVRGPDGWEYNQAHRNPTDQTEPVGHAVRALYMYSAMADVAALTGDREYLEAIHTIWDDLVTKKMYITGGIGQSGGNEGFGADYDLPNLTAYCETCASIAHVFLNHRMFLLTGKAAYVDVLERTLYNALLSGVSLSGDRFFYPNPLEAEHQERKAWFGCACCPSNISRFIPSLPGYMYATARDTVYVNLYASSSANLKLSTGAHLTIKQETSYPWDGQVSLTLKSENKSTSTLFLRIPGWVKNEPVPGDLYSFSEKSTAHPVITMDGTVVEYTESNGYAVLQSTWKGIRRIDLEFPMEIRSVLAHDSVIVDRGRFAIQRGPLVYCLEEADNPDRDLRHIVAAPEPELRSSVEMLFPGGIQTVRFRGSVVTENINGEVALSDPVQEYLAIPYAYRANRGSGPMLVWIPAEAAYSTPKTQTSEKQ